MAQIERAGTRQRIVADYAPGVQPRAGRIYRLVRAGAATGGFHEGNGDRVALEARGLGPISISVRITAVRKLAVEAADNGLLASELASGINLQFPPPFIIAVNCTDLAGMSKHRFVGKDASMRPAARIADTKGSASGVRTTGTNTQRIGKVSKAPHQTRTSLEAAKTSACSPGA
jgi:hypothetical protein